MRIRRVALMTLAAALAVVPLHAAEHVTLRNGFDMICDHREAIGTNTRLYVGASEASFVEVPTSEIATIDNAVPPAPIIPAPASTVAVPVEKLTPGELHQLLTAAGTERNLDVDLLAAVVHAESAGHVRAISRTGAQGLMQLMPSTAAGLGVKDSFQPDQNVHGGTTYLDMLLVRYHDNLALALAAYNAGPNAVDRYHGIPPYRETRAYVARIIHEFNQRKLAEASLAKSLHAVMHTNLANRD